MMTKSFRVSLVLFTHLDVHSMRTKYRIVDNRCECLFGSGEPSVWYRVVLNKKNFANRSVSFSLSSLGCVSRLVHIRYSRDLPLFPSPSLPLSFSVSSCSYTYPLHRSSDTVTIFQPDIISHAYLVTIVQNRRAGESEQHRVGKLNSATVIVHLHTQHTHHAHTHPLNEKSAQTDKKNFQARDCQSSSSSNLPSFLLYCSLTVTLTNGASRLLIPRFIRIRGCGAYCSHIHLLSSGVTISSVNSS